MKNKMSRMIGAFLCVCMIVCGMPTTAFAAESMDQQSVSEVVPCANEVVTGSIPAWASRTYTVHLNSYIGISKTFRVTAQSPSVGQGGMLDIIVKKDDKYISDGNWWIGVNETGDWKVTLPSSGDYSVEVVNESADVVYVTLQWL